MGHLGGPICHQKAFGNTGLELIRNEGRELRILSEGSSVSWRYLNNGSARDQEGDYEPAEDRALWNPTFRGKAKEDDTPKLRLKHSYGLGGLSREGKFEDIESRHDEP